MITATVANAQAKRSDFRITDVDTRRPFIPPGENVVLPEQVNDRLLQPSDELAHTDAESS